MMRTITFYSEIQNGIIKLPDEYKSLEKNKIEVILIVKDALKKDSKRSKEEKKAKGILSRYSNTELIKKREVAEVFRELRGRVLNITRAY